MKSVNTQTGNLEHIWSLIASASMTDQDTNNMSIFNIVERVTLFVNEKQLDTIAGGGVAIVPVQLQLITRLSKLCEASVDFSVYITTTSPSGKVTHKSGIKDINIPRQNNELRMRGGINELHIAGEGRYELSVYIKEKGGKRVTKVAQVPLDIDLEKITSG